MSAPPSPPEYNVTGQDYGDRRHFRYDGPPIISITQPGDGSVVQIKGTQVVQRVQLGNFSVEGVAESDGAVWVTVHSKS